MSDEEHPDSEFYYPEEQETAERKASRRGRHFNKVEDGKLRGPKDHMFKQKALGEAPLEGPAMSAQAEWTTLKIALVEAAEEVCGRAKYGKKPEREEWWWNGTVQRRET